MSNDMRIVKFEMMIRDIWEDLGKVSLETIPPTVIYDYDKLNDYGKVIMKQACASDKAGGVYFATFNHMEESVEKSNRMEYAKAIVMDLNEGTCMDQNKMHFLFWSLMILAVDDTDKEEHLSLICDFAKMLKISDIEMMDIVQVIQGVFHKTTEKIVAPIVLDLFGKVIERYGIKAVTDSQNKM